MSSSTGPASTADEQGTTCTAADSVYLLLEPMAAGRAVLDLSGEGGAGADRLRAVGASVAAAAGGHLSARIAAEDGSADIVVCVDRAFPDEGEAPVFLAELRRVLRPRGFAVVRVEVAALLARGVRGRTLARAAFERLLRREFAAVTIVDETAFLGVSFAVPGVDDVAVNEALAELAGAPSHFLAFCSLTAEPAWHLPESLLVPLGFQAGGGVASKGVVDELMELRAERDRLRGEADALAAERDGLRETVMTLQDQRDRQEEVLASLRREAERQMRRNTETSETLEVTDLERGRLERRLVLVERALAEVTARLSEQSADAAALRDEVARLRAARRELARIRPGAR